MKYYGLLYLIMIAAACKGQKNEDVLFQITEKGKIGFINKDGKIVISPQFLAAGEFAEGLAMARVNGSYGFVDRTGSFVIAPQFDFAQPFSGGLAVVYKNGQPEVINKEGQEAFETKYPFISQFENGRALVRTPTQKLGFIDKTGVLVIDTLFKSIHPFVDNLAVVVGLNHSVNRDKKVNLEVGIIDSFGKFVVPYGKYEEISDLEGGYFKVDLPAEPWDSLEGFTQKTGFIDKNGKLLFARSHENNSWIAGDIHSGIATINLYKTQIPDKEGTSFTTEKSYQGFINLRGEIIFNDTTVKYVNDFSDNRAFVQTQDREYSVVDTNGKIISKEKYSRLIGEGFKDGLAFVEKDDKYGMIDTTATFVIEPLFEGIDDVGVVGGYFFYYDWNENKNSNYDRLYGIAKRDGTIVLKPRLQEFDRGGFRNGLLKCVVDDKVSFVSTSGEIVWGETKSNDEGLVDLDIDFMNRGHFYASSKPDKTDLGGFGGSDNPPKKISSANRFPQNTLSVIVQPDVTGTVFNRYHAIAVQVVNSIKKDVQFNAQDSRLNMKVQAMDTKGEWKDIEYLPSSWCGNSYHTLTLKSKQYWTFLAPKYRGDFKTKLRIELKYIDPTDKSDKRREKREIIIYSNVYEGSVNPGQFWRKEDYYPSGIMDPYND